MYIEYIEWEKSIGAIKIPTKYLENKTFKKKIFCTKVVEFIKCINTHLTLSAGRKELLK